MLGPVLFNCTMSLVPRYFLPSLCQQFISILTPVTANILTDSALDANLYQTYVKKQRKKIKKPIRHLENNIAHVDIFCHTNMCCRCDISYQKVFHTPSIVELLKMGVCEINSSGDFFSKAFHAHLYIKLNMHVQNGYRITNIYIL